MAASSPKYGPNSIDRPPSCKGFGPAHYAGTPHRGNPELPPDPAMAPA